MPSQQVIDKLKDLQDELETVSSAVTHIENASKVAQKAADILKKISELIIELKSIEETHRKNLQKDFKEKIDSIEKQLQSMIADLKDKTKLLSQLIEDTKKLERSITDYFAELRKINFPERLDKIDNQISSINIGVGNLQTAIQSTQLKIDAFNSVAIEARQIIQKRQIEHHELLIKRQNHQDKEIKLLKTILFVICGLIVIGTIMILVIK